MVLRSHFLGEGSAKGLRGGANEVELTMADASHAQEIAAGDCVPSKAHGGARRARKMAPVVMQRHLLGRSSAWGSRGGACRVELTLRGWRAAHKRRQGALRHGEEDEEGLTMPGSLLGGFPEALRVYGR